jgi:hypothetical protein
VRLSVGRREADKESEAAPGVLLAEVAATLLIRYGLSDAVEESLVLLVQHLWVVRVASLLLVGESGDRDGAIDEREGA